MSILVPRLWPFLSHTTSSVRRSTLQTLKTLTQKSNAGSETNGKSHNSGSVHTANGRTNFGVEDWPPQLLQEALRHIYQRILVEHISDIQAIVEDVWTNLVTNADLSALLHAACPYVASWMCLAMQPGRLSFDPAMMIYAKAPSSIRVIHLTINHFSKEDNISFVFS